MKLAKPVFNRLMSSEVHSVLKKHMFISGYDLVFDINKSHGSYIVDTNTNKEYLDMFSFYGSQPISHNHPKLANNEFIKEMGKIAIHNPSNPVIYTEEYAKFVTSFERFCMPPGFNHLFFIAGGTLAVENALKVAFDWKVRKNIKEGKGQLGTKVIHFKEAFHGRSGYSLSLTNTDSAKYMYFPLFDWPRIINPMIKFPLNEENLEDVINRENIAINHIETILKTNGDDIASIILEPIQGEGGDNHFRPHFWQQLRKLADQYDVLLIADEVQSGMGLTGKLWAYEHLGASPDIIVFGKKAQTCGIICSNRIDDIENNVFNVPSRMNSTWGGNLVDMVRARKFIEIIEEENLISNAEKLGIYTLLKIHELQELYPSIISNVRGKGLMIAFDLPSKELCKKLKDDAYEKGLIIISSGEKSIRLRPMLDVKRQDIDKVIEILTHCLNNIH